MAARAPFVHGVASGDPLPDGVVLWTRVTPSAWARPGSGVGPPTRVDWEIARDRRFERIVSRGTKIATTRRDHTVHVDVRGLRAGTTYWYRFHALGETSRIGGSEVTTDGAQIKDISDGSTTEDAGLATGGVITKVDDTLITGVDSLVTTARSYRPGDTVTVTYERDGETKTAELELDSDADTDAS